MHGDIGKRIDRIVGEIELQVFRFHERLVLADKACLRLGQDAPEVLLRQRTELDADRQAALQFRQQIRRLRHMEGARRDEEDMVGLDRAIFRRNRRAFDQRQQVALNAFTGDAGTHAAVACSDLVDFVEEDDAVIFGGLHGFALDRFVIDQLVGFVTHQFLVGILDRGAHLLGTAAHGLAEHFRQVENTDIGTRHAGDFETAGHAGTGVSNFDIDFLVVELTVAQLLAEAIARCRRRGSADQRIEHALFSAHMCLGLYLGALLFTHQADADFDEVADDLFDVTADIADFGELRGFDLDEGSASELGEAAGDFRLADAGRANHQDVLGHDFVAQLRLELLAAPTIAQCDRHGALGLMLADNIAVEFGNDLAGGKSGHFACSLSGLETIKRGT